MKRLKTILKRAAIGILTLLLIFMGFLAYRNASSYNGVIHKDADAVVKIRVDAIGRAIAWDALKHPAYYYQSQKDKDTIDDKKKLAKGFGIPANVFLYTIKGKSASTIFTSFDISNSEDFSAYLRANFKLDDAYSIKNIKVVKNKDGKFIAAYTDKQCVLVYNPKKGSVDSIFEDILLHNKTMVNADKLFSKLKDASSHVNFVTLDDQISLDFTNGKSLINGHITMPNEVVFPSQTPYPEFSNESSLKFYLNILPAKKNEAVKLNNFEIETDSISKYYNGNISIEIANSTTQTDTIVTYEYNDDFEKVESNTASTKQVPEITIQLSAHSKKMLDYLNSVNITQDNKLNPELFPLYQVKIDSTDFGLRASTNFNKPENLQTILLDEVFELDIDFEKLEQQNHFPILIPYFKKLRSLNVKGLKSSSNTIKIEGQMKLKNEEILSISQFL